MSHTHSSNTYEVPGATRVKMTLFGVWKHGNHIMCQDVTGNRRFCPPVSQGRDFTTL